MGPMGPGMRILGALPSLQGGNTQRSMAQLQADYDAQQRDLAMADQLMNAGYVPNSGGLGALAQIFSSFAGAKLKKGGEKKLADLAKESFDLEMSQTRAKQDKEAREMEARIGGLAELLGGNRAKAEAVARGDAKLGDFMEEAPSLSMKDGYVFNPQTGETTPIEGYAQRQAQIAAAGRAPKGPGELEQRIEMARQMGASAEDIQRMVLGSAAAPRETPKQPTAKELQAQKDRQSGGETVNSLLDQLEELNPSTGPLDRFWPGENQAKYSAVQAQLLSALKPIIRSPGEGTFTDADLAALQQSLPQVGNRQEVNAQLIKNLREQVRRRMGAGGSGGGGSGGSTGDPLIDKYL